MNKLSKFKYSKKSMRFLEIVGLGSISMDASGMHRKLKVHVVCLISLKQPSYFYVSEKAQVCLVCTIMFLGFGFLVRLTYRLARTHLDESSSN